MGVAAGRGGAATPTDVAGHDDGRVRDATSDRLGDRDGVRRPGPAAPADDRHAFVQERPCVLRQVLGRGGVHESPADLRGTPGVRARHERDVAGRRPHVADHTQQLRRTLAAVRADRIRPQLDQALGDLRRRRAQQRAVVLRERRAHHDRERRRARAGGGERLLHLAQVRLRLDDQQVDAAVGERGGLVPVGLERILRLDPAVRSQPHAQRPHRTGHEPGAGVTGEGRRGAVELGRPRGETVRAQPEPVPPERVREDDVGAGVDERAMDLEDPLRVVDVQQFEARADRLALLDQRRAHAAVGQERPFGEEGSERGAVHHPSVGASRWPRRSACQPVFVSVCA